jgi:hypothetical protein
MITYINRKIVLGPYGGGNLFVRAFHEMAPKCPGVEMPDATTGLINPEVILLAGLGNESPAEISAEQAIMYKLYVKPDCKIVLRVNECDARKGTTGVDDMLLKVSAHVDGTVFVSHWLKGYFAAKGWECPNQTVIYNGCQRSIFKPGVKLNNGKLNIVAHHWSDNPMKGADIYQKLDELVGEQPDKFAFTYIGRHQCDFKHTQVIKPLSGRPLGEELGKHDIYVSASRFDPGPNHVLEALACGLPTYVHNDGGGAVEFAGDDFAYDDWDELKLALTNEQSIVHARYGPGHFFNPSSIAVPTWNDCVQQYVTFMEQVPCR